MPPTLRPFDWRDLPLLHRYRNQSVCMDSAHVVTHGASLTAGDLLGSIASATEVFGRFTWICANDHDDQPLMGQAIHPQDEISARIAFLAPEEALESPSSVFLLERLARHAGERGAFNLLAEAEEESVVFAPLRRAGFSIYARQRIWELPTDGATVSSAYQWVAARQQDAAIIHTLYQAIVPGLVQQVEPPSENHAKTLICAQQGELIGYADLKQGSHGIWVQPFVHPDVENPQALLSSLFASLPNRRGRKVYVCVRTYQSWLESALYQLDARPGPGQAAMVKRLTAGQRRIKSFSLLKLEAQREVTTPVSQMEVKPPDTGAKML